VEQHYLELGPLAEPSPRVRQTLTRVAALGDDDRLKLTLSAVSEQEVDQCLAFDDEEARRVRGRSVEGGAVEGGRGEQLRQGSLA
jgi:hypothetical protein